jgi:hypothetical protein
MILYAVLRWGGSGETFAPPLFYSSLGLFVLGTLFPALSITLRVGEFQKSKAIQISYFGVIILSVTLTICFLISHQYKLLFLLFFITLALVFLPLIVNFIDRFKKHSQPSIAPLADSFIDEGVKNLGSSAWELVSKWEEKYDQSLVHPLKIMKTEGFYTGGGYSRLDLDFECIFVPLRVVAGINSIKRQSQEIWDFLKDTKTYSRLAVIGKPGSGKTTLLQDIALTYAQNKYQKYGAPKKFIPILFYLRNIYKQIIDNTSLTLSELIDQNIEKLLSDDNLNFPDDWVETQLKKGNFFGDAGWIR